MSGVRDHPDADEEYPDVEIEPVLAYTTEIPMTRPWGLVMGKGDTPEGALANLCGRVEERGVEIIETLWRQGKPESGLEPKWRKRIRDRVPECNGRRMKGTFSIGAVRLTFRRG